MEFEAGSHTYRTAKLDTFKQLFIAKRLAPITKEIITGQILAALNKVEGEAEDKNKSLIMFGALASFSDAVGKLKDEDLQYIINESLTAAQRKNGQLWCPLVIDGTLMFQDLSPAQMLAITYHVLEENLGGFFAELRSIWETTTERK